MTQIGWISTDKISDNKFHPSISVRYTAFAVVGRLTNSDR
jgi:hypothetical protein